jgi:hypothetical protein
LPDKKPLSAALIKIQILFNLLLPIQFASAGQKNQAAGPREQARDPAKSPII